MTTDFALPIEIVRTNRKKTASIEICNNTIKITVPNKLTDKHINELIQKRANWITKKLATRTQQTPHKPKEWVNGETFTYLGRNYRLKLINTHSTETKLRNGYLEVPNQTDLTTTKQVAALKTSVTDWYAKQARNKLQQKTDRYAAIMNVTPNRIKIRDYKARWGSCSAKGDIAYNWRILIAPNGIVDYVVVHELAHLLEHNHSPQYWKNVGHILPDYQDSKEWLKLNANALQI